MNPTNFWRYVKTLNISGDGVTLVDNTLQFSESVPQDRQDALNAALVSYNPVTDDERDRIDALIVAKEREVTQRRLREAALTDQGRLWLEAKDAEIAALRAQRP